MIISPRGIQTKQHHQRFRINYFIYKMIQNLASQVKELCRFCNPPEQNRILFEGKYFYIMASLGPICEGYLLLVSKNHYECCGAVPLNASQEFDDLYHKIREVLKKVYGDVISYEHGRAGSCLQVEGSKHCYHAHMHFLSTNIEMNETVSRLYKPVSFESITELRNKYQADTESYVFVHDQSLKYYAITGQLESQYLRKIAARKAGRESTWDWVNNQNWPLILEAVKRLKPFFNNLY
jgi:diadenosine tetraphosphate (Ap4A) HIT family hydrolase